VKIEWGTDSEVGQLRAVMLRRPGPEIECRPADLAAWNWRQVMNPRLARAEHDRLAAAYERHGVAVFYLGQTGANNPNALYCRDMLAATPSGALIGRTGVACRVGEDVFVQEAASGLGIRTATITGQGTFEGADLLLLNRRSAFVGLSQRTNAEGVRQVAAKLKCEGVDDVTVIHVPEVLTHLDCMMGFAASDLAFLCPALAPPDAIDALRARGYRVIKLDDIDEVLTGFASNAVALAPGEILMPSGNPRSAETLRAAGVRVIEVDISELLLGCGGVHCCTAVLARDRMN